MKTLSTVGLLASMLVPSIVAAATWEIDGAHSSAQFSVRHMMVSNVRGEFEKISGTVDIDEKDLARSKVSVTIDVNSINTNEPKRDEHLKGADFFDAAKFPTITFKSTTIEKNTDGTFKVTGDLTMHGVTKPAVLLVDSLSQPVTNPWGMVVRGVSASGTINRKDWGLAWNKLLESGGVAVGEDVKLQIDAELISKPTPPARASK